MISLIIQVTAYPGITNSGVSIGGHGSLRLEHVLKSQEPFDMPHLERIRIPELALLPRSLANNSPRGFLNVLTTG